MVYYIIIERNEKLKRRKIEEFIEHSGGKLEDKDILVTYLDNTNKILKIKLEPFVVSIRYNNEREEQEGLLDIKYPQNISVMGKPFEVMNENDLMDYLMI